jgi:PIN domain nuclease of toxin-antitoxin system
MFLADACALIVFMSDPLAMRVMPQSFSVMRNELVSVSPITIWEITRKVAAGRLPQIWGNWKSLPLLLQDQGYTLQPFGWDDADTANRLPLHHKDQMDRMLIATALRADLTIISNDSIFQLYGVKTIW